VPVPRQFRHACRARTRRPRPMIRRRFPWSSPASGRRGRGCATARRPPSCTGGSTSRSSSISRCHRTAPAPASTCSGSCGRTRTSSRRGTRSTRPCGGSAAAWAGGGSSQRSARRGRTALVRGGLHARIIRTVQRRQIRAGGVAAGGEHGHRGDDDETTDWHRAPSWKCVQLEWVQLGALPYRVWRTRETTVSCCRSIAQPAWRAPAAAAASARATRIRAR
jgi:hypothetical protein